MKTLRTKPGAALLVVLFWFSLAVLRFVVPSNGVFRGVAALYMGFLIGQVIATRDLCPETDDCYFYGILVAAACGVECLAWITLA